MEEEGTEEEKHVPVSLHVNWIAPGGNTAEGGKRGGGFSCDSPLGLLTAIAKEGHEEAESLEGFHRSQRIPRKLESVHKDIPH